MSDVTPDQPRISVIMPTTQRPTLLRRALADVAAQTSPDWELVLVDGDGAAGQVEETLAGLDDDLRERIRVVTPDAPGLEAAMDAGVAQARGELVACHEVDDTWEPTFLERTAAHLDAHPRQAGVVTRADIPHEHLHGPHVVESCREGMATDLPPVPLPDLLRTNRFLPIQLVYRRWAHDIARPFRTAAPVTNWEFHARPASPLEVGLVDEVLAHWHQHPAERDRPASDGGDLLLLTRYLQGEFHHLSWRLNDLAGRLDHLDVRIGALEGRLGEVQETVRETGLTALARRKYWQVRNRLGQG